MPCHLFLFMSVLVLQFQQVRKETSGCLATLLGLWVHPPVLTQQSVSCWSPQPPGLCYSRRPWAHEEETGHTQNVEETVHRLLQRSEGVAQARRVPLAIVHRVAAQQVPHWEPRLLGSQQSGAHIDLEGTKPLSRIQRLHLLFHMWFYSEALLLVEAGCSPWVSSDVDTDAKDSSSHGLDPVWGG